MRATLGTETSTPYGKLTVPLHLRREQSPDLAAQCMRNITPVRCKAASRHSCESGAGSSPQTSSTGTPRTSATRSELSWSLRCSTCASI